MSDSSVGWDRSPRSPSSASTAPRVGDARGNLRAVTTRSSALRHNTVSTCIVRPRTASHRDSLHSLLVVYSRHATEATPPSRTAGQYECGDDQARSTPACPQGASPAFFFTQSNSTLSCPMGWYNWAWHASWSCSCLARRAEKISGISLCRRCFQWAIWVGCTPYVLANALTVLGIVSGSAIGGLHFAQPARCHPTTLNACYHVVLRWLSTCEMS